MATRISDKMLLYWLLTLLLPLLARGQQESCFVLKDSKACPGLPDHGTLILLDFYFLIPHQINDTAVQRKASYSTVQEFDAFIFGSLLRDQTAIEKFKADFGCPEFEGGKQRYKRSVLCFAVSAFEAVTDGPSC